VAPPRLQICRPEETQSFAAASAVMPKTRFRERCNDMNRDDESLRSMTTIVHAIDERLAPMRLAALGLQHMLVMCAGAIAVPLIVGGALKLPWEQVAALSA
jgi:hypothetical protein